MIAMKNQHQHRNHKNNLHHNRGGAVVEFAILLIPLVILGLGLFEYSRAIYQYNTLVKSVRSAARSLAQHSPAEAAYATHLNEARCLSAYGRPDCTQNTQALATGLTNANIKICDRVNWSDCTNTTQADYKDVSTGVGIINLVVIKVTGYRFPMPMLLFFGNSNGLDFGPIQAAMRQNG